MNQFRRQPYLKSPALLPLNGIRESHSGAAEVLSRRAKMGDLLGRVLLLSTLLILMAYPVTAGEFHFLGGLAKEDVSSQSSYAYGLEYLEGLGEHFALSISYLNQGHFDEHHLDGEAVSIWARTNLLDRRVSLAAGAGPFFYYDTTHPHDMTKSGDQHGLGGVLSLTATLYTESRWLFRIRTNWIKTGGSRDSETVLLGVGYQLDPPPSPGPLPKPPPSHDMPTKNEISFLIGETAVNFPADGHSVAAKLEYRRALLSYLDWTAGFIYEGQNDLINRAGMTTEAWLRRAFFDDRIFLGLGGGAYFAFDRKRPPKADSFVILPVFTMTVGYTLNPQWQLRGSWDRIITSYDRDADIFLGGLGYRF